MDDSSLQQLLEQAAATRRLEQLLLRQQQQQQQGAPPPLQRGLMQQAAEDHQQQQALSAAHHPSLMYGGQEHPSQALLAVARANLMADNLAQRQQQQQFYQHPLAFDASQYGGGLAAGLGLNNPAPAAGLPPPGGGGGGGGPAGDPSHLLASSGFYSSLEGLDQEAQRLGAFASLCGGGGGDAGHLAAAAGLGVPVGDLSALFPAGAGGEAATPSQLELLQLQQQQGMVSSATTPAWLQSHNFLASSGLWPPDGGGGMGALDVGRAEVGSDVQMMNGANSGHSGRPGGGGAGAIPESVELSQSQPNLASSSSSSSPTPATTTTSKAKKKKQGGGRIKKKQLQQQGHHQASTAKMTAAQIRAGKAPWRTHQVEGKNSGKWTREEAAQFQKAYNRYGKELEQFVPFIPTRNLKQIQSYFSMYKRHKLTAAASGSNNEHGTDKMIATSRGAAPAAVTGSSGVGGVLVSTGDAGIVVGGSIGGDQAKSQNRKWTDAERDTFHQAYQKHGKQLEKFVELIPSRTLKQIKAYFGMYKRYKLAPVEEAGSGFNAGVLNHNRSALVPGHKLRKSRKKQREEEGKNSGKWTAEEKRAFHHAYLAHGRKFKLFLDIIPTRTLPQIQSYFATYGRQIKVAEDNLQLQRGDVFVAGADAAAAASNGNGNVPANDSDENGGRSSNAEGGENGGKWSEEEKIALELVGFANRESS